MTAKRPYFWFKGQSVVDLVAAIASVGTNNARCEVHTSEDGLHAHFIVKDVSVKLADDGCMPINDSHLCPPSCE